jgi:hypothetical protein
MAYGAGGSTYHDSVYIYLNLHLAYNTKPQSGDEIYQGEIEEIKFSLLSLLTKEG